MRKLIALSSLALIGATPPLTPDAQLRAIVQPVSQARLRHTIESLIGFGTRHTLSSQTDPKRGIGAALNWVKGQFESDGLPTVQPCETMTGERLPGPTRICDMVAIQRGIERPNDVVIITGHIDSRVTDVMNFTSDAPGANDDGSGTAAVIEAARILSRHKFPGTIVYATVSGEEQGLYGAKVLANYAKAQGWNVVTDINNDIIGGTCGSDGICDSTHARVLSEGPRSQGQAELAAATHALGGENDAPSRNISRFLDSLADRLKIGLDLRQIWRTDRFGRGGDHIPFLELGYPAARLNVAIENYNWQHQDLRTENGIKYGDTIDHVDFAYLAKMTKLNVAALAAIASAPPPPESEVEGAVSADTTVSWLTSVGESSHIVHWRRTDSSQWEHGCVLARLPLRLHGEYIEAFDWKVVLKGIRVDDWVFGVSSVSPDGFESPVASAVPGGAFKPWTKQAKRVPEPSQITAHCSRMF
jgi:acetylornithine deacetylase/succinyl-diaminopimelate desuccinylase-like protein